MTDKTQTVFTGLHIVGQLSRCSSASLTDEAAFTTALQKLIAEYDLHSLGLVSHSFEVGGGFTSIVCLSESHIAVHTWPELEYVTLDVFLCNYSRNNDERCRAIFTAITNYFAPEAITTQEIKR